MGEWLKANVVLVVALDILLSLAVFATLELQQQQISANSTKVDCYGRVFDRALLTKATRAELTDEAKVCARLR